MLRQAAGVFNQTLEQVQKTIEPIIEKLAVFKSWGIEISVDYLIFLDYYAYLTGLMHHDAEVGGGILMSSRLFEEKHLANSGKWSKELPVYPDRIHWPLLTLLAVVPRPKIYRSQVSTLCSAERC